MSDHELREFGEAARVMADPTRNLGKLNPLEKFPGKNRKHSLGGAPRGGGARDAPASSLSATAIAHDDFLDCENDSQEGSQISGARKTQTGPSAWARSSTLGWDPDRALSEAVWPILVALTCRLSRRIPRHA
jgi:hypothetical protein